MPVQNVKTPSQRLPPWFKIRISTGEAFSKVRGQVVKRKLHTVCRSAACPNQAECWNAGTAAFMILGDICTRGCRFCNVSKGVPAGVDPDEPERVADAVASLGLAYAVITSVTRDDLPDGGARIFARAIRSIRSKSPGARVEVLIPDFQGSEEALRTVLDAKPDVLNHNLETVPSLYSTVRPKADYRGSLELLGRAKAHGATTKTGLMIGLGENLEEVRAVLRDIRSMDCDILTLGQYLRPSKSHLEVSRYYEPGEFADLREEALRLGIRLVFSGPLVRSSYHAEELLGKKSSPPAIPSSSNHV